MKYTRSRLVVQNHIALAKVTNVSVNTDDFHLTTENSELVLVEG